jgi:hypothetical protein
LATKDAKLAAAALLAGVGAAVLVTTMLAMA